MWTLRLRKNLGSAEGLEDMTVQVAIMRLFLHLKSQTYEGTMLCASCSSLRTHCQIKDVLCIGALLFDKAGLDTVGSHNRNTWDGCLLRRLHGCRHSLLSCL